MSCQSIHLDVLNKQIITPGRPSGVITFRYSTTINTSQKIKIEKIVNENTLHKNLNFFSTNLETGILHSNTEILDKGRYRISISTPYNDSLKNASEILVFYIIDQNEKLLILKKTSQIGKTVRMK